MSAPMKKFVLKHVFQDVRNFKENEYHYSPTEEHFNVPWAMFVARKKEFFGCWLYCHQPKTTTWSISTKFEMILTSVTGKSTSETFEHKYANDIRGGWGWPKFLDWKEMEKDYMIDEHIIVECHVEILEMTGIKKKKLRNFDSEMNIFSDVILSVEDEKFYVSKLFLATQSSYFESLLSKKQRGSKKATIKLDGCKSEDFQNFLELIYGESPIDDETVDGILHLADKYKAPTAMRKCEEFLINNYEKTLKEKLQMAKTYKLENLKMSCLSKIKAVEDIRVVLSYDVNEMDPSVVAVLLQKALSYLP